MSVSVSLGRVQEVYKLQGPEKYVLLLLPIRKKGSMYGVAFSVRHAMEKTMMYLTHLKQVFATVPSKNTAVTGNGHRRQ